MMRKTIIYFLMTIQLWGGKININSADYSKLTETNLTSNQINNILDYRKQIGFFNNIYELVHIENITIQDVHNFRHFIYIELPGKSRFQKDLEKASYKLGKWISNEGQTEGLSEIWLDRFFEPQNINDMNYDDLMSLPNLSPIDVNAILIQKNRIPISSAFDLKNSPGISYWGYKNLVDFVKFTETNNDNNLAYHLRLNSVIRTTPIRANTDEEIRMPALQNQTLPEQFHKISLVTNKNIKIGLSYHRYMGQSDSIFTLKKFFQLEKYKLPFNINIDKVVVGNFTASFGQGVIFESSDYFSPRRTGFGFSKRNQGIHGDMTRSCQYVLNGLALQLSNLYLRGSIFSSLHPRDAIINQDDSFTSLIVMHPRLPYGTNQDTSKIFHPIVSSLNEFTWGTNIRYTPFLGTNIGFTFYESLYDRKHIPQVVNSITGSDEDNDPGFTTSDYDNYSGDAYYLNYITNSADAEIAAMDTSIGESPIWREAQSFFRVRGFDFSTVIKNISIQGEYGEILKDNYVFNFGRNPSALLLSLFTQLKNLDFLILYRNYDLEFDNPYQRSFSNYQRYKTTIFEDEYWLVDPVYSFLYSANPQPQSEKGFFISSRYQIHRSIVSTLNFDTWNRKADNAKYYRTVVSINYRPVFNFRIKLRQKWQARGSYNLYHPSPFFSRESRIQAQLRMSNYNQFEILYSNGYTTFSPRPRLTDNALGGDMMVGDIGSPDETIGFSIAHHFDSNFIIKSGILQINGFLWYFEDTDFRVFNSENGATHQWISIDMKPTSLFRITFKISHTSDALSTRIVDGQTANGLWIKNPSVTNQNTYFRLQINYAL